MSSYYHSVCTYSGFPQWPSGKESVCKAGATGDAGSIPGLRRTPGRGNGNPLQYSFLENPMDRGAWLAPAHGVLKSQPASARDGRFHAWVKKIPWRREWQPTPIFLPGKSHGQRSLEGYSPHSSKESDSTKQLSIQSCFREVYIKKTNEGPGQDF